MSIREILLKQSSHIWLEFSLIVEQNSRPDTVDLCPQPAPKWLKPAYPDL